MGTWIVTEAPDFIDYGMVRWRLPTDEVWSMRLVLTNKVSTDSDESFGAGAACAKCVLGDRVKVTPLAALSGGGKVEGSKK